ncbi:hypothetical protein Ahy_A08g037567 isoform D [Arachis hypogaea]|uniref:Tetrapyrrole methylase domain-containing protein n=1 Tax=Arachis hypogaea TaxID=3818 RepID=A0A445BR60_ARAHY|nr:hypothetical protein Ahy_A08g037567 isoform D [Arachis hypogaea]
MESDLEGDFDFLGHWTNEWSSDSGDEEQEMDGLDVWHQRKGTLICVMKEAILPHAIDFTTTLSPNRWLTRSTRAILSFSLVFTWRTFLLQFWRGTVREAKEVFLMRQPKGELTILIEGQTSSKVEPPSDSELEDELRELIASGETLSTAVKLIAGRTSASKKTIYSLALKKFGKQLQVEDDSN